VGAAPSQAEERAAGVLAALLAGYLACLLAADHFASRDEQLALGVLTWAVLAWLLVQLGRERAAQVLAVVAFATLAEFTGSILWGVYRYRLHNLPLFIPPAHGIVFLIGLALARSLARHTRVLVATAAGAATAWALLGLTLLPRTDLAGAAGVPLLLVFLVRSRNRALYASVFLIVACLELYGTAIGTWRWAPTLPGLGIPDGNPPSGVASGYVWFEFMGTSSVMLGAALLRRLAARSPALLRRRPIVGPSLAGLSEPSPD
jgi:hypothetical protein